jgi:hypothetical protein
VPEEKAPTDRAVELILYAPLGAAMYARDMFPTMLGIFVSRGKREVQSRQPTRPSAPNPDEVRSRVEDGLGAAKGAAAGGVEIAKGAAAGGVDIAKGAAAGGVDIAKGAAAGGVEMAKGAAATGVGLARDVAGTALAGFLQRRASEPASRPTQPARGTPGPSSDAAAAAPSAPAADTPVPPDAPDVDSLPIPGYDELSASQVVERLEGLDGPSLDAIRRYETAHRGRNTILGKIAQLS